VTSVIVEILFKFNEVLLTNLSTLLLFICAGSFSCRALPVCIPEFFVSCSLLDRVLPASFFLFQFRCLRRDLLFPQGLTFDLLCQGSSHFPV
jgi:hypothetical protein